MPGRDVEETACAFGRACDAAAVEYAFIGGMAVNAWGNPRATRDIDVLLDLPGSKDAELVHRLRGESLRINPQDLADVRRDPGHVTVFDDEGMFYLDCKLVSTAEERQQVRDALEVRLPRGPVHVARPEDTVAYKLLFGSPQDLADARSIVERQAGKLDPGRLRALAHRLGVAEEVEVLLRGGT